jgi:hypothetical protein
MATLDADVLTDVVSGLTDDTVALAILNAACSRITANGYTISRIPSGSTSKTVNDDELGWIQTVAVAIYAKEYKQSGAQAQSYGIGGISSSSNASTSSTGNPDDLARQAAIQLSKTDWSRAFI